MSGKTVNPYNIESYLKDASIPYFMVEIIVRGEEKRRRLIFVSTEDNTVIVLTLLVDYETVDFRSAEKLFAKNIYELLHEYTYKILFPSGSERIVVIENNLEIPPEGGLEFLDDDVDDNNEDFDPTEGLGDLLKNVDKEQKYLDGNNELKGD